MSNITLNVQTSQATVGTNYQLNIYASGQSGMPPEIFVMQRKLDPITKTLVDKFVAVATPAQLESLPINCPEPGSSYFRSIGVVILGETAEYMQWVLTQIQADTQMLIDDLNALFNLSEAKAILIY